MELPILQFGRDEFDARRQRTVAQMQAQGLDGLILFRQESMYYLTGYDTSGYSMFQAGYLGADGRTALITRTADRLQSKMTSIFDEVRIWYDREDASPADELRNMLDDHGCRGKRLGIEYHAYGFTGLRAKMVDAALEGFCELIEATDLVREVRMVKSAAELEYVRRAGQLCDQILEVSIQRTAPGVSVKSVYGAMMDSLISSGGDPPASRWPMGAGEAALFGRYHTGDEIVAEQDQVVFEPAAAYRHYHAAMMYNIVTGEASDKQKSMNAAAGEAIDACLDKLRPGATVGEIYDTHLGVVTKAGFGDAALAACGYTLGIAYPPSWMDWPMLWTGNPWVIEAGMVFFMHMILFDADTGLSMCIGETAIVHDGEAERVNHIPREVIVK